MSDGVGHRQHRQAKGEGNTQKADAERRKRSGEYGSAATG
jgi:hypothetical protein